MFISKDFRYTYDDTEEGKSAKTMLDEILTCSGLANLEEIIIGCWGNCWDENEEGVQCLIDGIVENKEKFSHIKSLFFGDMDFEDCEVSWIIQGDYSKLWAALPQLEKLTIKGSTNLTLGTIEHSNLKHLEIICGGLPTDTIVEIQKAKLPALEKLLLYLGEENYGFDGSADTIKTFLAESDFPKLTYLGLADSEIEDEVTEAVFASKYINQITTLDLSMGCLSDKGGEILLEKLPQYGNIELVNLSWHFLSDEMMKKLEGISGKEILLDDQQEAEEDDGEIWRYPMLGE